VEGLARLLGGLLGGEHCPLVVSLACGQPGMVEVEAGLV